MPLPDFTRTTTFRWTLVVGGVFVAFTLLLVVVVYARTEHYLTARSDGVVTMQAQVLVDSEPAKRLDRIDWHLAQDPRGVQYAALFAADGHRIAGNVDARAGRPSDRRSRPANPGLHRPRSG